MPAEPDVAAVVLRHSGDSDTAAVRAFLTGLSRETRLQRFFNALPHVSPALASTLAVGTPSRLVVLALDGDVVVGHGMAVRIGDRTAEIGIMVTDAYQYQRIGTRLLRGLIAATAGHGVAELTFDVLADNYLVLDWLRRALPGIRFGRGGSTMSGRWPVRNVQDVDAGHRRT